MINKPEARKDSLSGISSRVSAAEDETNLLASPKVGSNAAPAAFRPAQSFAPEARATRGRGRGRGHGQELQSKSHSNYNHDRRAPESGSVQKRKNTKPGCGCSSIAVTAAEERSAEAPIPMIISSSDESDEHLETESAMQSSQGRGQRVFDDVAGENSQDDGPK